MLLPSRGGQGCFEHVVLGAALRLMQLERWNELRDI